MNRSTLVLLALASLADAALSHAADWSALPALPEPRSGAAAAVLAGTVHLVGGHGAQDLALNTMWSPGSAGWVEGPAMPETRLAPAAVACNGALYVFGGFDVSGWPLASVLRFDPAAGAWSAAAPLPAGRGACGAAVLGGSIYVAGGEGDYGALLRDALRYDVARDAWVVLAPLPTPRTGPALAALAGRVYVIGGVGTGLPLPAVEVFDPATGAWSQGPPLPEPLWQPAAAAFDGRLWVAGGQDASYQPTSHAYSLGADGAWRAESALPIALAAAAAAADSDRLVVAGGMSGVGPLALASEMLAAPPPPPPPPPPSSPPDTLAVAVAFEPPHLNPSSAGRWITVWLDAADWPLSDLDLASVRLLDAAPAGDAPTALEDRDGDGRPELMMKFARSLFVALPVGDQVLCLTGRTSSGTAVAGCGTLRIEGSGTNVKKPSAARRASAAGGSGLTLTARGRRLVFSAETPVEATLDVIDLQGRIVARLFSGIAGSDERAIDWPAAGQAIPSGIYFARFHTPFAQAVARIAITN
jgi:N-acetylneuraminic acid mutarotase